MKIGIDARLWNESGVGRYTQNLIRHLGKTDKKNKYALVVLSKDYEQVKKEAGTRFDLITTNIRWHTVKEQIRLGKILSSRNFDLFHFPYFSVPISYKRPFIVTIHDLIINHFPTGEASTLNPVFYRFKRKAYELIISKAAQRAKAVITVSETTKKEIVDHLKIDPKKIFVTYEGADDKIYGRVSEKKDNFFLYVGNAYPHKNLKNLIKAFNLFMNKNFKLVFVGKEDYFYRKLKSSFSPQPSIVFKGRVADSELSLLYAKAKALIMPSLMEGFSLPILEAISSKCLVLASDIPTFKEIYKDNLVYFNQNDPKEIAKAMKYAVDEKNKKEIQQKIESSFKHSKQFSWEKMAKETLKIYESSNRL